MVEGGAMLTCDNVASLPSGEDSPPLHSFEDSAMLPEERCPNAGSPEGAAFLVD